MRKLCVIVLVAFMAQGLLLQGEYYPNLKKLGIDDPVWLTCNNYGKALFFPSETEKLCTFLENSFAAISKGGCSQESLGLGFKGALKHFHEQNEETQILIAEIREAYLGCERHAGNVKITAAIDIILKDKNSNAKRDALSKIHTLGNILAAEYGEFLKREKPEQLKRDKEQKEKEKNRF